MFSRTTLWVTGLALTALCLFAFLIMFHASSRESAIMDELAHIPAGYGYVRYLDYRLNPEHPPLVKVLAALPLLPLGADFPIDHPAWQSDVNGQWDMGRAFLYRSPSAAADGTPAGTGADRIIHASRLGPMLLTVLLIVLVFLWSRELLGNAWALLPAALVGLSPHFLAHGHYVTTDIAAAFGVVLATRYFVRSLERPSRGNVVKAGLAFGIAMITKFSTALLGPFFVLLTAVFLVVEWRSVLRRESSAGRISKIIRLGAHRVLSLGALFLIGFVAIVYPAYGILTWNYPLDKQVADTEFILGSFAGGPPEGDASCNPIRCLAELNIRMAGNAVTRPFAQFFLGILMVLQRAAGGNTNYFLGQVSAAGWHHYFPAVYVLKEPLPVLAIVLIAGLASLGNAAAVVRRYGSRSIGRLLDRITTHFTEFAMLVFVLFYWAWSIQSPLNIGFRHLFPALPFMYMLAAAFWKRWVADVRIPTGKNALASLWFGMRTMLISSAKHVVLLFIVAWLFVETLIGAPYPLSYFNELGGGTFGGYRYVTDSNYDWGQDLLRLRQFVETRNGDGERDNDIDRIAVDYFGGGDPGYYLGDKAEGWWSARGNPRDDGIRWLAVSVNTLQGAIQPVVAGFERRPEDEYRWLTDWRLPEPGLGGLPPPDYRVGTSIFVYTF